MAATFKSDFLRILDERGFIHQCTDAEALDKRLSIGRVTGYIGFDCTAPSLHVGNLISIMLLRWLQKTGHKPLVLLGGGTTKIGDPSGKDSARKLLTDEDIAANMGAIRGLFERFLKFGAGPAEAILADNAEWLEALGYIAFLRDYGRHFSVNRMLTQDSVRLRLEREQNLTFLEFNYMVLQAYDFVELHRRYGCALQMGGSDQWGNIVTGIDLHRRLAADKQFRPLDLGEAVGTVKVHEARPFIRSAKLGAADQVAKGVAEDVAGEESAGLFGLTTPLLATASGGKMGKTETGAVWLNADMCPPYEYWQFWRNTEDGDVGRFLRLFTELPLAEIAKLEKLKGAEINEAKKVLATEATKLCHGDRAAQKAAETARQTFEEGAVGEALPELILARSKLGRGLPAYELFRACELVESGGEAKRLIRGGGARINDRKITDENMLIDPSFFEPKGFAKLSAGRKRHLVVKLG